MSDPFFQPVGGRPRPGELESEHQARVAYDHARKLEEELGRLKGLLARLEQVTEEVWEAVRAGAVDGDREKRIDDALASLRAEQDDEPAPCPGCGRMLAAHATVCMWCGRDLRGGG